ncbi:ABC transporter substrate-binding protein [Campylobacter geochelonis]|uniref:Hemin-binding periplasmic protein HmuT n=1 Tax=Campylobacter geochelonis TaxID=1780362 RepID=A0A128EEY1_9BACT|nr:ABC transporter substrate-binding protein [Campylobacter geochelonis]QKF72085.1 heme ABC transporter ChuBCD, periplasmic substrate-binding protein [Campylobacter geochelonis]CZE45872.1 hemin-binding periplasmic protein HmuT [Campylobacter geochelonis]CZE46763.1 hemin-binding periplasmic protein HmuT [Campylobacter geochelonis]CZE49826.1 hemin-binding periplasmic protein HmuT [Campylobacter geochelonis]
MKKIVIFMLFGFASLFAKGFVVLNPASVEIFYMLGCEDKISAIAKTTSSEIWPKEKTDKLPTVGTYIKANLEKIVELDPEMVITSFHSKEILDDLDRFGIKHIETPNDSIKNIFKSIKIVGEICHKEDEAKKLIESFQTRLDSLDKTKLSEKKAIFFYATANLMAFGKDTLPGDIFKFIGVKNLADKLDGKTPIVTSEFLIEENPDFMVIVGVPKVEDFLKQNPVLKHTNAAKNGKIIIVNSASLLRGTPRVVDEIEKLHKEFVK